MSLQSAYLPLPNLLTMSEIGNKRHMLFQISNTRKSGLISIAPICVAIVYLTDFDNLNQYSALA